ncbi:MAG TPA: FKBP-type peptidyl-prolyl cis-trans isomerase [Candidatus Kapabacteria bacterium]|jgi:FKBP-type peptidyl-prolyl cis-trans isomerase|nr:FKBP-type peptidyl-prolyl cis-trans isomerase [Candidatus Kapabacteria bacterium]
MRIVVVAAFCLVLAACQEGAGGGSASLKTQLDSVSYAVGLNLGAQTIQDSIMLNGDAILAGLRDAKDTTKALLNSAQIQQVMMSFQQKVMADKARRDSVSALSNLATGEKFLAENKTKEGVVALPSGVQYKVIKDGTGAMPAATDTVVVHYTGKLIDGKVFDSSVERKEPVTFALNTVIPGWTEALQKMKVGSKWQIYIPSNLAYGAQSAGQIPGNSTLIFDVELLDIKK